MMSNCARSKLVELVAAVVIGLALAGCARAPEPIPSATPPQLVAPQVERPATETPTAEPPPTETPPPPTPTAVSPVQNSALQLIQAFVDAPFRVVAVARSPHAPYSLIVATERAAADCGSLEHPQRCTADETCGSFYTSPTCYFFIEPAFDAAADPATRYVGRWPDEPALAGLVLDSLRFIDARTVEFRAAGGDGGGGVEELWWLDLVTGALALQSRVEQ